MKGVSLGLGGVGDGLVDGGVVAVDDVAVGLGGGDGGVGGDGGLRLLAVVGALGALAHEVV